VLQPSRRRDRQSGDEAQIPADDNGDACPEVVPLICRQVKIYLDCILVTSIRQSHIRQVHNRRMNIEETPVTKNYLLSDVVTKVMYFSFLVAAVVFVSMLLLAGVHL
jgi:hypothetical protein